MFKKIILIGPCSNKKNKTYTGGTIILFEELISWLKFKNKTYTIIDCNKKNYKNKLIAFVEIILQSIKNIPFHDTVSFHGTSRDFLYLALFIVVISKLFRKKITLRKFAGNFDKVYSSSSFLTKKIYGFSLRNADCLFFETKYLVEFGLRFNEKCYWLPNTRMNPLCSFVGKSNTFSKRFVFMSHIKKTKGIFELLDAFSKLDETYTLDMYGVIDNDICFDQIKKINIRYVSALTPDQVLENLSLYDVLILPSYEEGYPGIIIEALSLGIPVISTNVGGVPEIYTDGVEGYIVEPRNAVQLLESIKKINNINYGFLSKNALERFKIFDSNLVYSEIENKIF